MFLPRCLAARGDPSRVPELGRRDLVSAAQEEHREEVDDEPVKERCVEQRNAGDGEPRCAVCGRFGEYICDETGDDVCSLECKKVVVRYKELTSNSHKARNEQWEIDQESITGGLSIQEALALRESIGVSVRGGGGAPPPPPILDFGQCGFAPRLMENLSSAGYEAPTPIQMQVLPAALAGRDLLVSSHTGSGKTLSFLLPIIARCCKIRSGGPDEDDETSRPPLAMVLTPTRELSSQVEDHAKILAKGLPFKTALVVGGDVMPQQAYRIRKGVELIVGTPGRLLDVLSRHEDVNLAKVSVLVLDEVDCMLERGFREQVMQIVRALPTPQVMLFSATVPPEIEKFATSIAKSLMVISAGPPGAPTGAVQQTVVWVETKNKKKKLFDFLQSSSRFQPPGVVFVNSRLGAELLADAISKVTKLRCASLHGHKAMKERREVLKSFLVGSLDVIVATGVLGRGLDLLRATQVIIFDMPNTVQEYTHQLGRASRLDEPGTAIAFINNESKALFQQLAQLSRSAGVALPKPVTSYVRPRKRKAR
ncbi:DEAD-box ATP-dependent RNA helicase 41 isoform X2 [Selaginella moellendorffii]|uniref:DEAD-box ATP-dependent RNA helicase 41 isoform X2 n=1 Tax=Selaginella moellendorffii TaxID=88036 RepID=UPI000D1C7B2F|nr:DEAD-box ATP-dependent RNA helicase 41 isoform X2 [Selaginella moellendorffii]|eukprot:XP_002988436.2 DEAD-box ATP-dependent RNA helicase 41 isoform X2 [Selaginella moellendorffii]